MPPPSPLRPACGRRSARSGLALAALALAAASAPAAALPPASPVPSEPPRDPNDAPFLPAPNNQPRTTPPLHAPSLAPPYQPGRRLALSVAPSYASFRMPLLGRPRVRLPGVGVGVEGDIQILRWIWVRLMASYSAHPVDESRVRDEKTEVVTLLANPGTVHALTGGAGVAVGVDLGRFVPLLDVGVGAFHIRTPPGATPGQQDQPCVDGGGCDVGMVCGGDGRCHPGLLPEVHAGVAVELQLLRHLALGGTLRYFALLTAPMSFPIYVLGGLRLTARF